MKIETGKYYRTRGGDVVGPMTQSSDKRYPWTVFSEIVNSLRWTTGGDYSYAAQHPQDLISEVYVSDTPPADTPAPEAKTLRDEFASEAMKKLMDTSGLKAAAHHDEANRIGLGKLSYGIADAMMEARKK